MMIEKGSHVKSEACCCRLLQNKETCMRPGREKEEVVLLCREGIVSGSVTRFAPAEHFTFF